MAPIQAVFDWDGYRYLATKPIGDIYKKYFPKFDKTLWYIPGVTFADGVQAAFQRVEGAKRVRARAREAIARVEAGAQAQADLAAGRGGLSTQDATPSGSSGARGDRKIPKGKREALVKQLRDVSMRAGQSPFAGLTRQEGIRTLKVRAAKAVATPAQEAEAEEVAADAYDEATAAATDLGATPEEAEQIAAAAALEAGEDYLLRISPSEEDMITALAIAVDPEGGKGLDLAIYILESLGDDD